MSTIIKHAYCIGEDERVEGIDLEQPQVLSWKERIVITYKRRYPVFKLGCGDGFTMVEKVFYLLITIEGFGVSEVDPNDPNFKSGEFGGGPICQINFIPKSERVHDKKPESGSIEKVFILRRLRRLADRQILDGPLILNEVLQWCKAKKKQTFIFKIDFEKAYDSVRWDFLGDVLNRFGFGAKWCGWIQECLRSSRGSVLVNGSTTEEFQFYKGLKQGDPLSPFLFILVMESLHLSFKRVEDAGMFNGIKINSSMTLSHMFYADDAIFMGQWSKRNIDTLMYMLKCFERASGLSINLSKSKLMGLAVSIEKVEEVTRHIGCGILNTPFSFLGSKVGGCMSRI
ncbi:RNA-directed DNA polymerase, eukaryota [Tanacetum coccineum]